MSETTKNIEFSQYHRPSIKSGEYEISVRQELKIKNTTKIDKTVTSSFHIAGERFKILPDHIKGVFPPAHSLGEYANVFPHIILSRNTLPWERQASKSDGETPWLALLVIDEDEEAAKTAKTTIIKLEELLQSTSESPYFPGLSLEPGQKKEDKVVVLDIEKKLLKKIIPSKETLRYLTHIRQEKTSKGEINGADVAVLIANRLPKKGKSNTVHLISLEGRYADIENGMFDFLTEDESHTIRLISLYSWKFTSLDHFKISESFLKHGENSYRLCKQSIIKSSLPQNIKKLLKSVSGKEYMKKEEFQEDLKQQIGEENFNLHEEDILKYAHLPGPVIEKLNKIIGEEFFKIEDFNKRLTEVFKDDLSELEDYRDRIHLNFEYGNFAAILRHLDRKTATVRKPDTADKQVNNYLRMGFYPLPHKLRHGEQTVSWYHGPLSPKSNEEAMLFPVKTSDELVRYYEADGIFDVSYAAAWELGRLLAIQNAHFSRELYQWKRRYAHAQRKKDQQENNNTCHLQGGNRKNDPDKFPETLDWWLHDLAHLKGVPFNYLVPDEELLPVESIRFFQIDKNWVKSLLDGALSIGRVTGHDYMLDVKILEEEITLTKNIVSGFILRSEVVSGWPGMFIEGHNSNKKLGLVRREKLSENVLISLFDGTLEMLELHLKPDVLHFGVNPKDNNSGFYKDLRDENGEEQEDCRIEIPFFKGGYRVLDITSLIQKINAVPPSKIKWSTQPASSDLAIQLIEGVESVCFTL